MSSRPNSLRLNPEEARWLGVCAGIADWLDVPTTLVRIVFIICVISWPPLVLVYLGLYFCLDRGFRTEDMRDYFENAATAEHFKNLNYRKPIYKNESNKKIAGVCSGIADYLEVSPFFIRIVALVLLFTIAGPYAVLAYIICMVAFDPDPNAPAQYAEKHQRRSERRRRRRERREAKSEYYARRAEEKADARSAKEDRNARRAERRYEEDSEFADENPAYGQQAEATEEAGARVEMRFQTESNSRSRRSRNERNSRPESQAQQSAQRQQCAELYNSLEMRMREIEAYMTSKKFRLHCEINRA